MVIAVLIILFLLLVIFVRSEWGQGIIVNKAITYITDKTHTKVEIEKLYITFDGDIMLKGLYMEDKKGDTLIYSKSLEANVPLWPMIKGNGIGVDALDWKGVRANIIRKDSIEGYNFQFLIDAFAAPDSTSVAQDTTASKMNIILGNLDFEDFNVVYKDDVLGIDSQFKIGTLQLDMEKTDIDSMDFRASKGKITNSRIKYIQSPVPPDPYAKPVPLPFLSVDELSLQNVFINYASYGDRISAEADLIDFYVELKKADLPNNDIEIGELRMKNSVVRINTQTENNAITEKVKEVVQEAKKDIQAFDWPNFRISIAKVDFQQNNISYFAGNAAVKENFFNPNAIALQDFSLRAKDIFLKDKKAGLQIEGGSFQEGSGLNLKELALTMTATDTHLNMEDMALALNDNKLTGKVKFEYNSLLDFIENPEESQMAMDLPSFQIDLRDVFQFQPDLKKNEYLRTLSKKYLTGNITASGYLSSVQIPNLNVQWGNGTRISATGNVQNITHPDNLQFNLPRFSVLTRRSDLLQFVSEKDLGVTLPETVSIKGQIKGNLNDVYTKANITTSQGIAIIDGHFKYGDNLNFDADIEIKDYQLSKLLNNNVLGNLSLSLKTHGKGKTINDLDATLDATISSFKYNNYQLEDLKISGEIKDGTGNVVSNYKDHNLNLDLKADVVLDSVATKVDLSLNVIGADLQALGLMQRDVRAGLKLDANFEGTLTDYDVIATVGDGVVVYDDKAYLLGDILATGHVTKDTTSVWFDNKMLHLTLESNTDPASFSKALQRHIASYFYRDEKVPDTIKNPVKLYVNGKIRQAPVLNKVFLVNVRDLDTISIGMIFNESERLLKAKIIAPHINYNDYELDSLAFSMETDKNDFDFDLGFNEIKAGPFDINQTILKGHQANNELSLNFLAFHKDSTLLNVKSKISGHRERLLFHVLPDSLVLNKRPWEIPENNEIIITKNNLEFTNFKISRDNQSIELTDNFPNVAKNHVAIDFKNFDLQEVLNYLNPEEKLAKGTLEGDFVLVEPFGKTGILADLSVRDLNLMDVDLGILKMDAKSKGGNSYIFDLGIKEGEVDLDLTGDYLAAQPSAKLNLDLDINKFNMKALEGFSMGEIKNADGSFSGEFDVTGTVAKPKYTGSINFHDADFNISKLNAAFTLKNEEMKMDNKAITMNNFTVLDENKNTLVMSGSVGTESFLNPTFDLKIKANNFQVLNATKDDNEFVYGKAAFDADAIITGDLQIPKIDVTATVTNDTDVTYVLPTSAVSIEERGGVVIFVNRENPDAILTRTAEETVTLTGFDISALVKISNGAKVKVIIDQETGDNFLVYGDGDFDFTMNPNGRMNLSGVYDIAGGHYEMNLYKLVNRSFELTKGSRVSWSGDPFDAKLDIKALYEVEASASPLMAPQTSGLDPSIRGKFRQVLPFYVYLNVDGELTAPKISFSLDMPEDEQGAIGGQVYGRVQQVNAQEDELNRQVFSLLVLNRFYPEPGSDGSRGGFASIARDNLNDALSDQLNAFSDKLLGNSGVKLDFGLDSYTDYQGETPQARTQLEIAAQKKLFNDRLIVRVGSEVDIQGSSSSGEATPLIGNVSLEYLLTENGRYRLKGFRRNEYENVIDGQTIVSGIALIFTQEFNKFSELWDALLRSQAEARKAEMAAKEKIKEKENEPKIKE